MRLLLLGPPGAGKGTQAQFLSQHFRIPAISSGDMLRQAIQSQDEMGQAIQSIVSTGGLVPDNLIGSLVTKRLSQDDCIKGYLLDGFPRTLGQAQLLEDLNVRFDHIVEIQASTDEILKRLAGRFIHLPSGRTYHLITNPPKISGKDDVTGEPLVQREDDNVETIKKRLEVFQIQTEPLRKWYIERHASYHIINGEKTPEQVQKDLVDALHD